IHDNDRLNDSHQIPFSMSMDFVTIARALKEIDYKGYFTLECNGYFQKCPEDEVASRFVDLAFADRRFVKLFEEA
ncbi:hypothetical protein, partial [Klebsiella pneumoniae]|uniref:hypothetical protein n=1 Tax=Klebsiella pneumoniae TaxID=573 RepID=UPI001C8F22E5